MNRLLLLPLLLGIASPVQARVDPEVHKLCKDVKDYLGCVKAQSGEVKAKPNESIANSCPPNFAYNGGGYCRKIVCIGFNPWGLKGDQFLERKHQCRGIVNWETGILQKHVKAVFDNSCPNRKPGIGWQSTCHEEKGLLPGKVPKKKNR